MKKKHFCDELHKITNEDDMTNKLNDFETVLINLQKAEIKI